VRVELDGIRYWRHDLTGCLHITMAALLGYHGLDPLEVLGAGWGFFYDPRELRREEYYFPCRQKSLLGSLAPYHGVSSRWHQPEDAEAGWREVREAVASGRPVGVAVDNFQLPFRPAYQDVHTNHMITVFGFDDERGEALVTDPVPPRFTGPLDISVLTRARTSPNPIAGERDLFFTANPIANRWLDIEPPTQVPEFDRDFLREVIAANLRGYREGGDDGDDGSGTDPATYQGLAGERRFLDDIADKLAAGRTEAADEGFVVAGPVLATTGLHADWLARAGRIFGDARLIEAARAVERVAHHWSAFRIAVATAREAPPDAAGPLRTRAATLVADHDRALDLLDRALG
jgi:hypothetical protein